MKLKLSLLAILAMTLAVAASSCGSAKDDAEDAIKTKINFTLKNVT